MTPIHTIPTALGRAFFATCCLPLLVSIGAAQDSPLITYTYTTFTVPGATFIAAEAINNTGTVSGYYGDSAGDTRSYLRASNGTVSTYIDPKDTTTPSFTQGGQINKSGTVAGEFFDTSISTYVGYLYKSVTGTFRTYEVPGEPAATTTGLYGVNDRGGLCGFVIPPPYTVVSAFVDIGGTVSIFSVNGAATSACNGINDSGETAGYYTDSSGVYHAWIRSASGTITPFDVPGASTTPGSAPCISSPIAGTVAIGINNTGYVSGHYWDTSNNEHGFIRTPTGKFIHINVTGAYQSSAGGLNDKLDVTGHYVDSSCVSYGYVATP